MTVQLTAEHRLSAAAAAHDAKGNRLFRGTKSGYGRARCSCGWLSEALYTSTARRSAHKTHQEETMEKSEPVETVEVAPEPKPTRASVREQVKAARADTATVETVEVAAAEDENGAETPEVPVSGKVSVEWPKSVAKLFFRALAKDGARVIAESRGLVRVSNESKLELTIEGDPSAAAQLAGELPGVFHFANQSLKNWRRTSSDYKQYKLNTSEGRKDAFTAEQDFLRDFCRGVAGTFPEDAYTRDGVQAGVAYVNSQEAEDIL